MHIRTSHTFTRKQPHTHSIHVRYYTGFLFFANIFSTLAKVSGMEMEVVASVPKVGIIRYRERNHFSPVHKSVAKNECKRCTRTETIFHENTMIMLGDMVRTRQWQKRRARMLNEKLRAICFGQCDSHNSHSTEHGTRIPPNLRHWWQNDVEWAFVSHSMCLHQLA